MLAELFRTTRPRRESTHWGGDPALWERVRARFRSEFERIDLEEKDGFISKKEARLARSEVYRRITEAVYEEDRHERIGR